MSRLIVKNLPSTITEKKLREIFEEKGFITDLQLKYNKSGVFRKFAFVGYKTEEEAKTAKEYFNNTFIFTSKINIEICSNLNDPNKPKPWKEFLQQKSKSKEKDDSSTENQKEKKNKSSKSKSKFVDVPEELKNDPKFKEFMAVHEDRKTKPLWADEVITTGDNSESDASNDEGYETIHKDESSELEKSVSEKSVSETEAEKKREKGINSKSSELEESTKKGKGINSKSSELAESAKKVKVYTDLFTVKVRNLPYSCKKKNIRELFHPLKITSLRLPPRNKGFAYVSFKTEKDRNIALTKNKGFLNGHRIEVVKYTRKDQSANKQLENKNQQDKEQDLELLAETGRIFVRNLCHSVTESELEELFSKYGLIEEIHLPMDLLTKKTLGFAFVTFVLPENAVKAFSELDGTIFQGRLLHLIPAKPKKEIIKEDETNYKKKKEAKLKASSGSSHNWNILFLSMNAVADVISEKYKVEKSQLLSSGDSNESVAVRMALAETQIVLETRKFLINNGVQLDAFSQAAAERSKTVIVVKHLPAKTSSEEISELFSKHGTISRVIVPPSGLVALVEFQDPTEAKAAFKKLAYTRFRHLPLYLEWAPMNAVKEPPPSAVDESDTKEMTAKEETEVPVDESKDEHTEEFEPPPGTTLFVKNINFNTTQEKFKKHFETCGPVHSAVIATKKDMKSGKLLSMGFGFVQYKKKSSAEKAIQNLQLSKLDGHSLEIKYSTRATLTPSTQSHRKKQELKNQETAKILVKNIPFEASVEEVRDLFKEFGTLKFVRLPKKMGKPDEHRGFGFVEYMTKSDAKRAFEALCHSTHFFGRRLVLEWANTETDDVSELRKKTARDFVESGPKRKVKKSKLKEDVAMASAKFKSDE